MMISLDWNRFQNLPGDESKNFEKICKGILLRHFGAFGSFYSLKNQPGVELYLSLNKDHPSLGKKDDVIGWQNKWFVYKDNGELTNNAKKQILHSLDKSKEHVSQITHWNLWTHQTLAKCDQEWYYALQHKYNFTLNLWNQDNLDGLLSGPALDLRNTYFGELALTHKMLQEQHEKSIAPIKKRWLHEVHQRTDAELKIRQVLGEKNAWVSFTNISDNFKSVIESIDSNISKPEYSIWKSELELYQTQCKTLLNYCELFDEDICGEDIEEINKTLEYINVISNLRIQKTLAQIRSRNLPLSLTLTNATAYIKDAKILFYSAVELLSQQFIAVLADAGGGKTQLAAELTAQSENRSAGLFLLGSSLKNGMNLNDLAKNIIFYQTQVNNFEALISAINSVGERSNRRLPIIIDGLNEAQDPREWKPLFESILPLLKKYPNVVIICTLRTTEKRNEDRYRFGITPRQSGRELSAQNSLPESAYEIFSEGYHEELTIKAIKEYCAHYKIKADPISAPLHFFSHPLNLKIFCEVTSRKFENQIQSSYFPSSIYSLFGELLDYSANSIEKMTNFTLRNKPEDIKKAIYFLGESLWVENARSIQETLYRERLELPSRDWNSDIVNLLVQEGIIFRDESDERYRYILTPVYDRLGGYLVAEYLLRKNSNKPLNEWIAENEFIKKIFGEISEQHPLSQDILSALVVMTPKTLGKQQIWKSLPKEFQSHALELSYLIDKDNFSQETFDNYKSLILQEGISKRRIDHLLSMKYVSGHPLNAEFLNMILLNMTVSERDLSWTEYLRNQNTEKIERLRSYIANLKSGQDENQEIIRLKLIFYSWYLTSTVIDLRDSATELLFHLGKKNPEAMFQLTLELLAVNDPYVSERLLASSYSLVTFLIQSQKHKTSIINFGRSLYRKIFEKGAQYATTHILSREYASCILKTIAFYQPDSVSDLNQNAYSHPFPFIPRKEWKFTIQDEESFSRFNSPFRMDFENYTIGRLIKGRRHYDFSHEGYKIARGNILLRVNELGWSYDKFEKVENFIDSERHHLYGLNRAKTERYGKKYSWIAYYELAGQLNDEGKLNSWDSERFATDIDPFFPKNLEYSEYRNHDFLLDANTRTKDWILDTELPNLSKIIEVNQDGIDWVLLDGFISEESKKLDRNFFCIIETAFIFHQDMNLLENYLEDRESIDWPEKYGTNSIYSGELYFEGLKKDFNETAIAVTLEYENNIYDQPELTIENYHDDKLVTREVPIIGELNMLSTVINFHWENSQNNQNESINRLAIAPWIIKKLELSFNPSNFEYFDQSGKKAVLDIHTKGDTFENYRNLLYIRKDLFEQLSNQSDLKFIKRLACEKKHAKFDNLTGKDSYRRFETII